MSDSIRTIDKFLFRENFNSVAEVGRKSGVITNVSIDNGVATPSSGDISYPDIFLPKSGGWSMRCILKHDLSSNGTLFASDYVSGAWTRIKLNTDGSISMYNDNAGSSVTPLGVITTNTWHDLVITNDLSGSSNLKFYVDGVLVDTNNQSSIWNKVNSLFNRGDGASDFLVGECALAEIYSSVLPEIEIANLYDGKRFYELNSAESEILNVSAQSGSIVDRWGNALTLTDMAVAKIGEVNAMSFNGNTSLVDCGDITLHTFDKTCVAWLKPYSYGGGGFGQLWYNGKFYIYVRATNTGYGLFTNATMTVSANDAVQLNSWQMIAVTITTLGIVNFYVNGEINGTPNQDATPCVDGITDLIIGATNVSNWDFDGLINDSRIYSGILTPPEISQLYTSEKHKYNG